MTRDADVRDRLREATQVDDRLDDLRRARIWARLEKKLAAPPAPKRRAPVLVAGSIAVLGAAAVAALWLRGGHPDYEVPAGAITRASCW